jgi:hypothetical protein
MNQKSFLYYLILLLVFGAIVILAVNNLQKNTRFVHVKGLAEREVLADKALWLISYSSTSNTLSEVYQQINKNNQVIKNFLLENGLTEQDVIINPPSINDTKAQVYGNNNYKPFRYIAEAKILVNSTNIEAVRKSLSNADQLIAKDISLNHGNVEYMYSHLNDIKPDMVEEATKEARKAASKFATNSGANLGSIKRANQGIFSITNVHYQMPYKKKVRVVTDIDYYLN